ncbi:Cobalamin (vitamin B12) biosynthesis CbiG, core [Syntrophomonas zehnderi OL-4]|uniref:Cobalamin (Vitamin B12) biosynthesis CbiG, core n=1 Tax=Syntrophomonas zehnderi OL-4 TaxID=690567 RepID=A0A0E4GCU7_9FIRM|nr:cobalt-precorrin 5A hydrolase [Syntrophomonas zehnderi]CFY06983.1 Cobalamin (vitamin B12) biosynthesis CbiG, core [Syntrophomonas zehnderi OL-4]
MNTDQVSSKVREKKTAILCLTENGLRLAEKLAGFFPDSTVYMPCRLAGAAPTSPDNKYGRVYVSNWTNAWAEAFKNNTALICIMAVGIVVRSLADLMVSKFTDPAVVVMDEKGEYVISLLSGHLGGANQLARAAAGITGGQAVITTASDVEQKTAVDLVAQEIDAVVEPWQRIKTFNRYLIEGQAINLYSPWPWLKIPAGFCWQGGEGYLFYQGLYSYTAARAAEAADKILEPAVIISPWKIKMDNNRQWVQLRPRNLAVGMGCRRNVSSNEVMQALEYVMEQFSLDIDCVKKLATIDLKAQEPALLDVAARLGKPFLSFNANEIRSLDGTYEPSAWVKEKIGVGGVCEPAAQLAAGRGITLAPKQKIGAVTISVAMEKSWWWDWDLANVT